MNSNTYPTPIQPTFLDLVPQPVKTWAYLPVGCGAVIGTFAGYHQDNTGSPFLHSIPVAHPDAITGFFIGTLVGVIFAIWLLCLGYVFADARRRAMPPAAWMFVAMLVPNLLGFLLYFVFRKPVSRPCAYCGQPVNVDQRFCPSCGQPGPAVPVIRTSPPSGFSPPAAP